MVPDLLFFFKAYGCRSQSYDSRLTTYDSTEMITAWLRIHNAIGGRAAFPAMWQKYQDVQALCRALETRAEETGLLRRISPDRFFAYGAPQALATEQLCRQHGWQIVPYTSDYYPALLRQIKNPPAVLFARGDAELLKNPRKAAVVGTRSAARKAADAAFLLGEALAESGVTTVSGGAAGIDCAAAFGASAVHGAGCITVLGRGFSPAKDVGPVDDGVVFVTELFPGLSGRSFNFPNRNRLISGMSAGTAVLEAGGKSGALITAQDAMAQGRPVFVPSSPRLASPGCAALAEKGVGRISSPRDLIGTLFPDLADLPSAADTPLDEAPAGRYEQALYGRPGRARAWEEILPPAKAPDTIEKTASVPAARTPAVPALPEGLSPEALAVARAAADGPVYIDEIILKLGIPAPKVQAAVTELELEDVITVGPGGRISLR